MLFKGVDLQLMKVEKREGIAKTTQKGYLFYVGTFIDSEGDKCNLKFGKQVENNVALVQKLLAVKNVPVTVELSVHPSGFDLKGIVQNIEL
jgi:hypothetical protein